MPTVQARTRWPSSDRFDGFDCEKTVSGAPGRARCREFPHAQTFGGSKHCFFTVERTREVGRWCFFTVERAPHLNVEFDCEKTWSGVNWRCDDCEFPHGQARVATRHRFFTVEVAEMHA